MRKFLTNLITVGCIGILSFALNAQAGTIQLAPNDSNDFVYLEDLISGNTDAIVVGDKVFEAFSYSRVGDVPSAGNIKVLGIMLDDNYGIRFQGGFKDLFDDENESSDALIGFDVSVTDPTRYLISDVHLDGNPSLSIPGSDPGGSDNAFAEVVETIKGPFGTLKLQIQEDLNGAIGSAWIDPLPWPVERLSVLKDIQLLSIDRVRATLSYVDQTFSQVIVPEPATVSLILCAGSTVLLIRRRRGYRFYGDLREEHA